LEKEENVWEKHYNTFNVKAFDFDELIIEMEEGKDVSDEKLKDISYDYLDCLLAFNTVEDKHAKWIKEHIESDQFRFLLKERGFWILDDVLYPTLREIYMSYDETNYFSNCITEHLTKKEVLRVAKERECSYISMDEEYFYHFRRSF